MDVSGMAPIVVFDDRCYLCVKFAKAVDFLARGRLTMVGHYTPLGERLGGEVLGESAREMFWLIDGKTAYGGRAALLPLARAVASARGPGRAGTATGGACGQGCRTAKSAFVRSSSLFTNSKKIPIG